MRHAVFYKNTVNIMNSNEKCTPCNNAMPSHIFSDDVSGVTEINVPTNGEAQPNVWRKRKQIRGFELYDLTLINFKIVIICDERYT